MTATPYYLSFYEPDDRRFIWLSDFECKRTTCYDARTSYDNVCAPHLALFEIALDGIKRQDIAPDSMLVWDDGGAGWINIGLAPKNFVELFHLYARQIEILLLVEGPENIQVCPIDAVLTAQHQDH